MSSILEGSNNTFRMYKQVGKQSKHSSAMVVTPPFSSQRPLPRLLRVPAAYWLALCFSSTRRFWIGINQQKFGIKDSVASGGWRMDSPRLQ